LKVALEPTNADLRQPARFLPTDEDRQLERFGQADPSDLTRKSLGNVEIAVLQRASKGGARSALRSDDFLPVGPGGNREPIVLASVPSRLAPCA
jgi:hypothetical protein